MTTRLSSIVRLCMTAAVAAQMLTAVAFAADDPFAKCAEQFARKPDDYESAYCFYEVTLQKNLWDEGARTFDSSHRTASRRISGCPWRTGMSFAPAIQHAPRRSTGSRPMGFNEPGHVEGEILARSNLRNFLFPKGRVAEAAPRRRASPSWPRGGRSAAEGASLDARSDARSGDRRGPRPGVSAAEADAKAQIFPDGPYRLKRTTLNSLGSLAFRLGRLDEALAIFQKLDDLAAAEGEGLAQANAQYNILNTSSLKESLLPSPGAQAAADAARRALAWPRLSPPRIVMSRSRRTARSRS